MKSSLLCCGALLVAGAAASLAHAQYPYFAPPVPPYPIGCIPMCMPAPHSTYPYGTAYSPAYVPDARPCMPFNGILPTQGNGDGGGDGFPQHPYIRSPRDFFMYYDRDNNGHRP